MKSAIAYIRVSTQKQGKSGLGLEAQQALIQRFADQEGFQIAQTFTEVQSGKDSPNGRSRRWPRPRPMAVAFGTMVARPRPPQSSGRRRWRRCSRSWQSKSAREIARILNERNVATPTGKPWSAMTVIRARDRLAAVA